MPQYVMEFERVKNGVKKSPGKPCPKNLRCKNFDKKFLARKTFCKNTLHETIGDFSLESHPESMTYCELREKRLSLKIHD
jgi:hypothetical protein